MARNDGEITHRELARLLTVHPIRLTKMLPSGIGAAIVQHSRPGVAAVFSRWHVDRWREASNCRKGPGGLRCPVCRSVLAECAAIAEHLLNTEHGLGGCDECSAELVEMPHGGTAVPPRFDLNGVRQ